MTENIFDKAEQRINLVNTELKQDPIPDEVLHGFFEEASILALCMATGVVDEHNFIGTIAGLMRMAYAIGQRHTVQIPEAFKGALDENP